MSEPASTSGNGSKYLFWGINSGLGIAFLGELAVPKPSGALDAATLMLAVLASIAALHRQLPLQNVLPAAFLCALLGGVAHGLTANPDLALPFGPVIFSPAAGAKLFQFVPWSIPLLWIVALFNARGTARLILRPWRKIKTYGVWLIGLTAALAVAFDLALEPYASWPVKHWWHWQPTKIPFTWQGATPLNFFGWLGVSLLILTLATPLLIRKQPGQRGTAEWQPCLLWLGALVLFGAGAARAGLWWPVGADAALAAVTGYFAVRGARW